MAAQLEVLAKAAAAGCQLVDVELQTASKMQAAATGETKRTQAAVDFVFPRLPRH